VDCLVGEVLIVFGELGVVFEVCELYVDGIAFFVGEVFFCDGYLCVFMMDWIVEELGFVDWFCRCVYMDVQCGCLLEWCVVGLVYYELHIL